MLVDLIKDRFADKSLLLLGFGREGQSTYALLRKIFPGKYLTIADFNDGIRDNPLILNDPMLYFITGPDYLHRMKEYDVIFRSPGIPVWQLTMEEHAVSGGLKHDRDKYIIPRAKITSQTELFLECYSKQVIGITGTKGKSTTSSLIHHIFKTADRDVLLVGNIGHPVFHFIDLISEDTTIVFEMSSHQLEFLKLAPHIAVLLNLFQEHLDAYESYDAYKNAKLNITKYQQPGDFLVYNEDDFQVKELTFPYLKYRNCTPFSLNTEPQPGGFLRDGFICFADHSQVIPVCKVHQDRFLRGEHNLKNILAAVNVAMICGIETEMIEDGIATFKGLEHRLEYVGEFNRIHFYNDSIATIPEACIEAIKAIPNVDTLVAGGFDRGIDYSGLADFLSLSGVSNFILMGAAGKRIMENLTISDQPGKRIFFIDHFDDFMAIAMRETRVGQACVLSPAAASYDEFKNFEERGKRFRSLVKGEM